MIKFPTLLLAATCWLGAIGVDHPAFADDARKPTGSTGGVEGKFSYCTDCHGGSGQGYQGYYTMPRLAGQTTEYLTSQLRAFAEHTRDGGIPVDLRRVHALSGSMRAALAAHFRSLDPQPVQQAQHELVARGRTLYQEGAPQSNVPACLACHGPAAQGIGGTPRLAGQLFRYTRKQLTNWSRDRARHGTSSEGAAIMQKIAGSMSRAQIEAVASYLNTLR